MANGGIIGPKKSAGMLSANGLWRFEEEAAFVANNSWPSVVTNGLVLFLDSSNPASYPGSGTTWYDLSSTGLNFTGTASYLSAQNGLASGSAWSSASTSILNTDTHTLSFYIKFNHSDTYPQGTSSGFEKLFTYAPSGTDRSPGIWRYPNQRTLHWRFDPGNTEADLSPTTFGVYGQGGYFALNCWYHVCVSKNGATATGYVNGVKVGTNTVANPKTSGNAAITLFESYPNASANMDYVQVYNRALSDAEVLQNYKASQVRLSGIPCAYLVVGGGGGGGKDMGGGGGAGGYTSGSSLLTPGTYSVTVGAGGYGSPAANGGARTDGVVETQTGHQFTVSATNGGDSILYGVGNGTAVGRGGGYGGSSYWGYTPNNGYGSAGGSGGGSSGYKEGVGNSDRAGATNQVSGYGYGLGNTGGQSTNNYYSGGGGGAGGVGNTGSGSTQSDGGVGVQNDILGTNYYWAGGGGGAGYSREGGNGGAGGGGAGAVGLKTGGSGLNPGQGTNNGSINSQTNTPGADGGRNTGGGGGGGSHYNAQNKGGEGGSGIVVVRYPDYYPDLEISSSLAYQRTTTTSFKIYSFLAGSGTFTVPVIPSRRPIETLIVGGGGGGGSYVGGGGGGGGVITSSISGLPGTYTITVGAGGSGGTSQRVDNESNGGNSSIVGNFYNLVAIGGGRGARYPDQSGYSGGSGGGHGGSQNNGARPGYQIQATSVYGGLGNNGASSSSNRPANATMGGGGGGAGTAAVNNAIAPGDGGDGIANSILGTSYYWGGGGGGGGFDPANGSSPTRSGNGGLGSAGNGGCYNSGTVGTIGSGGINAATQTAINAGAPGQGVGGDAGANTGSGGGGCGHSDRGGNGGSGIVVLRFPNTYPDLAYIGPGLTYTKTSSGGYTIYAFTAGTDQIIVNPSQRLTDPYAAYLKLALPLRTTSGVADYSATIRGYGTSYSSAAVNSAAIDSTTSKFYSTSLSLTPYTSLKHVAVPNDPSLWLTNQDFTIEGWWYFTANNVGYHCLASHSGDTADAQNGWVLYMESNNTLNFIASSGWALAVGSSTTPTTGVWHHVAVSRASNTTRLFLDGVQIGSSTAVVNIGSPSTRNLRIGDYYFFPGGERGFSGYVQDFRMYIGAGKYTANFTPTTIGMVP
jgi:Concanavalin A-like lectin/glucanases superfamily